MATSRPAQLADFTFQVGSYTNNELRVVRFSGSEAISELFSFDLELASEDNAIDFDKVVGQVAKLTIFHDDGARQVSGLIRSFAQGGAGVRFTRYQATLVPTVWPLTQRIDSRIFQDLNTPDIVKKVLQDAKIPGDRFRFSLQDAGKYKPRNYCVQYRETDFTFVARLLEEEGINFFFEHTDKGDTLVMADWPGAHVPINDKAEVVFREVSGLVPGEEYVSSFTFAQGVRPGKVALKDYAFKKPGLSLDSTSQAEKDAALEVYDYPGEYVQGDLGDKLVKVRLDEVQATRRLGDGQSSCRRFLSGYCFTLADHPRKDFNGELLLVRVLHTGNQRQSLEEEGEVAGADEHPYSNQFECIPSKVAYRPPRVTPHPVISGVQTATVVGPDGEEIYCDEYGRIKVHFHWDRKGKLDDKASCWVRVAQPWAGNNWGFISIPRIGQEVVVEFLEGDPDRPLVTGSVYNADQMPPYKLPDQKTKSTWKSDSSIGSKGFNEFRFEDKKGSEQIFMHGEKDLDIRIKNDRREWIGRDRHLIVKRDKKETIERDLHSDVQRDLIEHIERDHHLTIDGKEAIKVTGSHSFGVTGDVTEEFQGNHSEQVTRNYYLKGMQVVIEGMVGLTLKVGSNFITINPAGIQIVGMPMMMLNSGGSPLPGMAGNLVSPQSAAAAAEADTADPGDVSNKKGGGGAGAGGGGGGGSGGGAAAEDDDAPTHNPNTEENKKKKSWIEIELVDEEGNPVPGEPYKITLPDGRTIASGTLDDKGFARVDGIDPGTCKVTFPRLDKDAWEPK